MSFRLYFVILSIGFLIEIEGKSTPREKLFARINHLLNITDAEKKFDTILETYINSDGTLSIYKSEMKSFIDKFLSFQSLRPHIVRIYRDLYTLSDVNGMIKFYASSLGKKVLEKEVQAEIRLSQLIKTKLQEQMPQVISWFQQAFFTNVSNNEVN
ncbi:unnamed protein product [Rotaria magnacalcarata]|uniref:DUF2059 domain-containing protein n=1 Tax=Rotaria magnacalcarata TaxID=392030 RepID=A0A815QZZ6_9BILA|nr:unnamed protein product [Rotaria magnacalcarata]CAF1607934.1 unnamed protein product [Rotaria magnacalcarata]CAF2045317.1 unnamed protein product [Rotaria magnacalcarata]CAF2097210.1 unnamed protein product [Rotaria magnacalcarata]CAF2126764.1 unnamed protein product [Rotaria magnacalcarata]